MKFFLESHQLLVINESKYFWSGFGKIKGAAYSGILLI